MLLALLLPLTGADCSALCAQNASKSLDKELTESVKDISSIELPPIDLLFENAKKSPSYQIAVLKVQTEKSLLRKEKRAFLGYFSLRGSYQYGMFGNESTYTDVSIAPYLSYSTQAQNGYTVGAGISIPLDGLFDLRARVKRQKLTVQSSIMEQEVAFETLKKEIVEQYTVATSQLRILKLRAESLELAQLQYNLAEQDFINGSITSSELSMEKERHSKALEYFEDTRYELIHSLMLLEITTRTPLINKVTK
jgi:outer membrane protein TolC